MVGAGVVALMEEGVLPYVSLQTLTGKLNGPGGAMGVLFGNEQDAKKISTTLERTNALLAKLDGMAAKADTQVFGDKGVLPETRATVVQLNALLGDARQSLKKVDTVLQDAQAITANAKGAQRIWASCVLM